MGLYSRGPSSRGKSKDKGSTPGSRTLNSFATTIKMRPSGQVCMNMLMALRSKETGTPARYSKSTN